MAEKYSKSRLWVALLLLLVVSSASFAKEGGGMVEPSYCDPNSFDEKEFSLGPFEEQQKKGLVRAHAFKLGKVILVGAGVGNSNPQALIDLSKQYGTNLSGKKFCTWYYNHPRGNQPEDAFRRQAAQTFIQRDLEKSPVKLTEAEAVSEFSKVLKKVFDEESTNFLSCAESSHYLAMGCNEMMHRGPTVFGMLLAFSGCSPEHSLEITDQVWGLNGVRRKVRLAVIRKAYEWGSEKKQSRKRLSELFSE